MSYTEDSDSNLPERDVENEMQEDAINRIFGDTDSEDEFDGFQEESVEKAKEPKTVEKYKPIKDVVNLKYEPDLNQLSPLKSESIKVKFEGDIMASYEKAVEKIKKGVRANRSVKRTDADLITAMDDKISDLVSRMRLAALEDKECFLKGEPAMHKLLLLTEVRKTLININNELLIESKFLNVVSLWLEPPPDKTLPPLDVRNYMLTLLSRFPSLDYDVLKESSIGKALTFMTVHPRELLANKQQANKILDGWKRVIFNKPSDFNSLTREERLQRDMMAAQNTRRVNDKQSEVEKRKRKDAEDKNKELNPGEPGFIPRATIPQESKTEYVVRPAWKMSVPRQNGSDDGSDDEYVKRQRLQKASKTIMLSKAERTVKRIADQNKKRKKIHRAATVNISGKGH